ncbi:MAG: PhnB protein [Bradyrhizobium sp.]|jgi:PhnB protein
MHIQPYLFFNGHCEDALTFYRKALDVEVSMMMRYKDSPEPMPPGMVPPHYDDKILHATFHVGTSTVMASDSPCPGPHGFQGFALSVGVPGETEAVRVFAALGDGGQVTMPLSKTFWSPRYGMLIDRFGVTWMVGVEPAA